MKKLVLAMLVIMLTVCLLAVLPVRAESFTEGDYTYEVTGGEATITDVNINIEKNVVIPSMLGGYPVTAIGEKAFYSYSITSVVIPDSVKVIDKMAFDSCDELTSVEFGTGITEIGSSAFYYCKLLSKVDFPDSLKTIAHDSFSCCFNLTEVSFGSGLKCVEPEVFQGCKIQTMTFDGCSPIFEWMSFTKCKIEKVNITDLAAWCKASAAGYESNPLYYSGNLYLNGELVTDLVIPDGVTSIGQYMFQNANINTVTIPDGVAEIGYGAFSDCENLTDVTIADSVTDIAGDALSGCTNLVNIRMPNGIGQIDGSMFDSAANLHYNIYDQGLYLGNEHNPYVALIRTASDSITSCQIHPDTHTIASSAFFLCEKLTEIAIPDGVTCIGYMAFSDCAALTNATIPSSIRYIGPDAFANCTNLKYNAYDNALYLGNAQNPYLALICAASDSISDCKIHPDSFLIASLAFYGCEDLTNITISDSIMFIGDQVFENCVALTEIMIPNSVAGMGNGLFAGCNSLTKVKLPDNTTQINDRTFSECIGLTSATIPDSVTGIGDYAFSSCNFTDIFIPDSVTYIGYRAFFDCPNLTSVTISDQVAVIDAYAFFYCDNLKTVYYTGTEEQWEKITFSIGNLKLLNAEIIYNYKPAEPEYGEVEGWNLILKEDIGVNFQVECTEEIKADANAYVEVKVAEETRKIPISSAMDGFTVDVAPAQMTEQIQICIVSGDGMRDEIGTYYVADYADAILTGDYNHQTKMMVLYILSYGAAAQKYFDYNEDKLANEGISCALAEVPTSAASAVGVTGTADGVAFYGASLRYDNKIALRYYFTGDVTGCTFTANGKMLTPVETDGRSYVEIGDILPQNLDAVFFVTVKDGNGKTLTVTYNPVHYIVRMYNKADATEETKNLLQALYTYHLAAKLYTA